MNKFRIALGAMALVMAVVAVTSCNKERDLKYSSLNMGLCLKDYTCNTTPSGCGLLYMYECKGHCENEIVVVEVD